VRKKRVIDEVSTTCVMEVRTLRASNEIDGEPPGSTVKITPTLSWSRLAGVVRTFAHYSQNPT
jgi:hypothetical protein